MIVNWRKLILIVFWNLATVAVVFLPVFLVSMEFELRLRGAPGSDTLLWFLGSAAYTYLLFVLPLALASLVYSVSSLLLPYSFVERHPRLAGLAVTPVIPASLLLLHEGAAIILWTSFSTVIAMFAFGIVASIDRGR